MPLAYEQGREAVLLNVPHAGTRLPAELSARLTPAAAELPDTDWHVDRLTDFAPDLDAHRLCARMSRYVIDLNRGADDQPLYSGPTTGLVPVETFAGAPLYRKNPPDQDEVRQRVEQYWRPYHDRLQQTLENIRERHGFAVLLDVHSIRSRVPRLFDGALPDLNLGTFDGRSCAPELQAEVVELLQGQNEFSHVVNGRFKGGFITRYYGQPVQWMHALQLEISQACYMDEDHPRDWDPDRAEPLRTLLRRLVNTLIAWRPS